MPDWEDHMSAGFIYGAAITAAVLLCAAPAGAVKDLGVIRSAGNAPEGSIELRGVQAGAFDPSLWQDGSLNLLPDVRSPLIDPLPGACRNIYAPSAVQTPDGWRVFYGAWDGVPTPNDRIYSVTTPDFLSFNGRHMVIEHGPFQHVCNVNALRLPDGSFSLICTAMVDEQLQNKPVFFHSPDGRLWNGKPAPYVPSMDDMADIQGYAGYATSDINGMNVILYEDGVYRLFFSDFRNFGKVYRATSRDGLHWTLERSVLDASMAVNDVKKFRTGKGWTYLMGLHMNGDRLWYSLSADGLSFGPARELCHNLGAADRYIVALGWVVQGDQERGGRKLLGVLYGAGADEHLASNRIFARWLQKKVVFVTDDGERLAGTLSRGPGRQILPLGGHRSLSGRVELYAEDGCTLVAVSEPLTVRAGQVFTLR